MKALPEGKSLGWMQAPASWIGSHTVRFMGVVRVVIQDGEGFILIKKGKPLFHYFKHGTIELKGHTALDYFNSHPIIEFNLCKYTPDEFAWAMKICNIEDHEPVVPKEPAVSGLVAREQKPPSRPADPPIAKTVEKKRIADPVVVSPPVHTVPKEPAVSGPVSRQPTPPSRLTEAPVAKPAGDQRIPDPVGVSPQVHTVDKRAVVLQPVVGDDQDVTIISQIRDLNGIVAIAVFNDKRTVIMMGDADSEVLLKIARKMLETAKKITPRLTWGPFVHMTLQVKEGNMIIAPYYDNYLCLLTTRTINIGHIRRILRDLQQKDAPQRVS
jgi:predicted regulator of Ras-like GTPase activity (Roadblock/LC7/MglB family)